MVARASSTPIPAIDIEKLTAGVPRGSWVAISSDDRQRLAVGQSVHDVISQSKAKGETEPLVIRVPDTAATLIL